MWHFDKRGEFPVKSTYRLAHSQSNLHSASSSNGLSPWWKQLWSLSIPNKIKLLEGQQKYPSNQWRRGVVKSAGYDQCGSGADTVDHAIWGCSKFQGWFQC
ncbi:hypothetical protein ACOSQ4_003238 [Xanthoceras sorbifolium]